MTILHISDLHYNRRWFNWLTYYAPAHDLLVLAGDLLNHDDATPLRQQIEWVSDWIRNYAKPMCICSGRHDLEWDPTAKCWVPAYWLRQLIDSKVRVDGQRVIFGRRSILNIGYTTRPKGGRADIWVVHTPPAGTRTATGIDGRDGGDLELATAALRYRPSVILSGGVHCPVSWCDELGSSVCLNLGRQPDSPYPNHILLKTTDLSCRYITAGKNSYFSNTEVGFRGVCASVHDVARARV